MHIHALTMQIFHNLLYRMFVTIPMAPPFLPNKTKTGIATSTQTPVSYRHNTSCDSSTLTVIMQSDVTTMDIFFTCHT